MIAKALDGELAKKGDAIQCGLLQLRANNRKTSASERLVELDYLFPTGDGSDGLFEPEGVNLPG